MRAVTLVAAAALAAGIVSANAQSTSPPASTSTKADEKKREKPVVMTGCVTADASAAQVTFTDAAGGERYRLTGASMTKYAGQRVQIVGRPENRRVKIAGGLTPSPNVAAQAGAIDPARAAVAAAGGGTTGTGNSELPSFRVARVSAVTGDCPH